VRVGLLPCVALGARGGGVRGREVPHGAARLAAPAGFGLVSHHQHHVRPHRTFPVTRAATHTSRTAAALAIAGQTAQVNGAAGCRRRRIMRWISDF
jgi:hypothetical protein